MSALLEITDLRVHFNTDDGVVKAVDGVSLTIDRGEIVGIAGESGAGKSVLMMTVMGLTRSANADISGSVRLAGRELLELDYGQLRAIRGNEIAMIFQDPLSSLHPMFRVGDQIVEGIRAHNDVPTSQARARAVELLGLVGVPSPKLRVDSYPHQLSGGMRQRVMIAMALANEPALLIADEPTTALDVTVQAQIIQLIERLQGELDMAVALITHDLGVIAEAADRAQVMYAGQVIERGGLDDLFYDPQHPYSWGLLGSVPRLDRARPRRLPSIKGQPPSLISPPSGCRFRTRCPHEFDRCSDEPDLVARLEGEPSHLDRCFLPVERKRTLRQLRDGIGLEEAS